jgi:DNA-binding MarR family transcriptional regulator
MTTAKMATVAIKNQRGEVKSGKIITALIGFKGNTFNEVRFAAELKEIFYLIYQLLINLIIFVPGMEKLERVVFYMLDKAIKTYRQFAQRRLNDAGLDITIDQWLVLNTIESDPGVSQLEIAEKVFKDAASVTRIIDLLIKKSYLLRRSHPVDRRRFTLELTGEGKTLVKQVNRISEENRRIGLKGLNDADLEQLRCTLSTIINNCQ